MPRKYLPFEKDFEEMKTVQQTADLMGVHWQTVLSYIRRGKIGAIRMGNRYRVPISEYKKFIEVNVAQPKELIIEELKYKIVDRSAEQDNG